MTRGLAVVAAFVAMSGVSHSGARADVWQDAISSVDQGDVKYATALEAGDNLALQATAGNTAATARKNVENALTWYRAAAALKPTAAEPYYRIGQLLSEDYFVWCEDRGENKISPLCISQDPVTSVELFAHDTEVRRIAKATLAAWDAFEARAPLDPRITASFLFDRAILRTKLATHDDWVAAAHDYEKLLARDDFSESDGLYALTEDNLAETYMMLDRLDDAIEMYRFALRHGAGDSLYGLAVALDRNEETDLAKEYILQDGLSARRTFIDNVAKGNWFFVPAGEKYYYLALIDEAFSESPALEPTDRASAAAAALDDWRHYVDSGAHPQFQPRAAAHIAALQKRPAMTGSATALMELDDE